MCGCPYDSSAKAPGGPVGAPGCPMGAPEAAASGKGNWEALGSHISIPEGLSAERAASSIPSETGRWTYPSERQFYKSVPSVVAIHNAVNEETWSQILKWEEMHKSCCSTPKLLRFAGRPNDLSLKARVRSWGGFDRPFDRHDWIVDRCGTQVRYIIDFYDGKRDGGQGVSIFVDARPDMSTLGNVWDRMRMFFWNSPMRRWWPS